MSEPPTADLLGPLAEVLLDQVRRGEPPAAETFLAAHPDRAAEVRELIAAVAVMERLGSHGGPERFGDYRVVREIGRGGMGVVYEAEQISLGRRVALKVLLDGRGGAYRERFRREAWAVAKLHHTNIVPVYGVGDDGDRLYYAMQLIDGESLDVASRERQRPEYSRQRPEYSRQRPEYASNTPVADAPGSPADPRVIAGWIAQAADGVAHAHARGVLHRDIKPANLLLDRAGTVWVADFGLAKADDADDLTATGDLIGTLRYMAPERFHGVADARGDVYALGATLYELLAGRPAFDDANRLRLVEAIATATPVPLRRLAPAIPRDLETVVHKALARDPADRYATAAELADDLRRVVADRPIHARRQSAAERLMRWGRRNRMVAALTGAVAALLLLVAVGSSLHSLRLGKALETTAAAERAGRLRLFEAYLAEARANLLSRRGGQRFDSLARLDEAVRLARELDLPPERFADLRTAVIAALTRPDIAFDATWDAGTAWQEHFDFSEDLTRYAAGNADGSWSVRRSGTGEELARLTAIPATVKPFFGVGGTRLALMNTGPADGTMHLWALDGPRRLFADRQVSGCDFRADGKLLALCYRGGAIALVDPATGDLIRRLDPAAPTADARPALHPSEPLVAVCSYLAHEIALRDTRDGRTVATFKPPWRGGQLSVVWSPDGRTMAVGAGNAHQAAVVAFDPAAHTFGPSRLIEVGTGGTSLAFHPAGGTLASTGWSGGFALHDLGNGRTVFATHSLPEATHLRFDPSGRRLSGTWTDPHGRRMGTLAVSTAREYRAIPFATKAGKRREECLTVHPGGRLAVVQGRRSLVFVDLDAGQSLATMTLRNGTHPVFQDDGALVTSTSTGCFRWPVAFDGPRVAVGPPERLPLPGGTAIGISRDGASVAMAAYSGYGTAAWAGGWLLHADRPDAARALFRESLVNNASISPDGRWAAYGIVRSGVKVFDARADGPPVWDAASPSPAVCFSRDGRWLGTNADGGRLVEVGTWKPGPRLGVGHLCCFSHDGRVAVLSLQEGVFRLVAVADGRELARLEDPDRAAGFAALTPDGARLVAPAADGARVWDLRAIRQELAARGLDWDEPPYPAAGPAAGEPLAVTIVGAEVLSDR